MGSPRQKAQNVPLSPCCSPARGAPRSQGEPKHIAKRRSESLCGLCQCAAARSFDRSGYATSMLNLLATVDDVGRVYESGVPSEIAREWPPHKGCNDRPFCLRCFVAVLGWHWAVCRAPLDGVSRRIWSGERPPLQGMSGSDRKGIAIAPLSVPIGYAQGFSSAGSARRRLGVVRASQSGLSRASRPSARFVFRPFESGRPAAPPGRASGARPRVHLPGGRRDRRGPSTYASWTDGPGRSPPGSEPRA